GGQIDIAADGGNVVIAGDLADTLGLSGTINDGNNDTSAGAGDLFDGLTLDTGDFTLAVGDGDTVDLAGTYVTGQDLVDAINSKVSGATAVMQSDGTISIYSTDNLTIGGAEANATLGFTAATLVAGGNLTEVNVLDADAANDAIMRVDAALTAVSDLRSTLGAIQNRFESTINNLQTVSENLSASRSRIQDTDFAAETAALTRAQILQQAGTAMVAQANTVPQNVLSLLR